MQKRIFTTFILLIGVCVVTLVVSIGLLFLNRVRAHEMAAIRDNANLIAHILNQSGYEHAEDIRGGNTRMTIICADGWIIMDSHHTADITTNRSGREEFIQATIHGRGEAIRDSDTLRAVTFYYAIRLQDGSILRFSRTLNSLGQVVPAILPILVMLTLAIFLLAYIAAYRLTRRIIKPLLEVDFENTNIIPGYGHNTTLYEEIWPYIKKIEHQRLEISKQLATSRHRADTIEAIISNMREGLLILDENALVMVANKSVLDIFKISKEIDIKDKNIRHIFRDLEFNQNVKTCYKGKHLEMQLEINKKVYNVYLNPVEYENNRGIIVLFLDITERYKAESQRKEFTANVSHELKTPLTTISALSEMMVNGMVKSEDISDFAQKISGHAARLINIIEDIIRLSEFDEKKVTKDYTVFDIYELAKSVSHALSENEIAIQKSVSIGVTGQAVNINANYRLLDELLHNLISNSVKYNKDGGRVAIEISKEKGWCKLTVSDTGIGISKEHQARVFERFYRVDNSRSKKTGGTGLGLSIVKHIVDYHNGHIIMDSKLGSGTTVVCKIRL